MSLLPQVGGDKQDTIHVELMSCNHNISFNCSVVSKILFNYLKSFAPNFVDGKHFPNVDSDKTSFLVYSKEVSNTGICYWYLHLDQKITYSFLLLLSSILKEFIPGKIMPTHSIVQQDDSPITACPQNLDDD